MEYEYETWELSKYKVYVVEVQKVRWEGSGTKPAGEYTFSMERGIRVMNYVQFFFGGGLRESYQQFGGVSLLQIGCHI
jgi:hypothetical protein